jgi:hypothetical protein
MTRRILIGALILTALALVAGSATAQNGWISGTISDTNPVPQGNPISGATVSVVNGTQNAASNATGYFNLTVPDGNYTLKITKAGYVDKVSERVTVHGNKTTLQNFFLVKPTGNLTGTVTDSTDGTPIGYIDISYSGGNSTSRRAKTDDSGKYNLTGLPVGTITIHVSTYTVFYNLNNDANYIVTITAGQTATKDFQLPAPPVWVNGTVEDTKGNGIFGATVKLGNVTDRVIDLDGTILFLIEPGTYPLEVSAQGYDPVSKNIIIDKNNKSFEVALKKTGTTTAGEAGSADGTLAAGLLMLTLIPVIVIAIIIIAVIMWRKKKKAMVAPAPWAPVPQAPWEPPRI